MDVGRDRAGRAALRNRRFRGHRVVEAAAAVTDVEDERRAASPRGRRGQLSVLHDVGERQVDEARRDELARHVEKPHGASRRYVGLDGFDDAVADADVALGAQRLARVQHLAAFDHEVELVVWPDRRCVLI